MGGREKKPWTNKRCQSQKQTRRQTKEGQDQGRFRLLQGVDLSGMELGAQRGTSGGGAPLLDHVLERCPHLKPLRAQVRERRTGFGGVLGGGDTFKQITSIINTGPRRLVIWVEPEQRGAGHCGERERAGGGTCVLVCMSAVDGIETQR